MWTITVGAQEHARAVVMYAADIGCIDAKSSYDDLRKWYHIEIDCELKYRRQIYGFVQGLEWFETGGPPVPYETRDKVHEG